MTTMVLEMPAGVNANGEMVGLDEMQRDSQQAGPAYEINPALVSVIAAEIEVLSKFNAEFREALKADPDGCIRRKLFANSGEQWTLPANATITILEDTANTINLVVSAESRGRNYTKTGEVVEKMLAEAKESPEVLRELRANTKGMLEARLSVELGEAVVLPADLHINLIEPKDRELVIVLPEAAAERVASSLPGQDLDLVEEIQSYTDCNSCQCFTQTPSCNKEPGTYGCHTISSKCGW